VSGRSGVEEKLLSRLTGLIATAQQLIAQRQSYGPGIIAADYIPDTAGLHEWRVAALNLLERGIGRESQHFKAFWAKTETIDHDSLGATEAGLGILRAAMSDVEGGLLFDTQLLVAAEVFDDLLEQAGHLIEAGYKDPAAMLTGAVLEATLRRVCGNHGVVFGARDTIEPLNQLLAKAGVYTKLVQKRVTAWADIRNNADHARFDQYTCEDVEEMRRGVRDFAGQHLS
jgi:hypothetical protein